MDTTSPSLVTRFKSVGIDNGWVAIVSRAELKNRFGDTFGNAHLSDKRFPGFAHFGGAEEGWTGTPICLLNLRSSMKSEPEGDAYADFRARQARPAIYFYVQKIVEIESWTWTLAELFDQLDGEIQAWEACSEFDRIQGLRVLYCVENGSLRVFRNTHRKGFR